LKIYEYVIRRLALMILVLFGVSVIVFYLARGFPSAFAPWAQYVTFRMKPSQIEAIIRQHGFDQPLYVQYWYWLQDIFRGDWGYSNWANGLPTYEVFASRFPFTVELTIAATILTMVTGIPLGILSALKNNTAADHAARIIALTGYSTPAYWFAYILQLVFFYYFYVWGLPNLPSGGVISQGLASAVPSVTGLPILDGLIAGNLSYTADAFVHVILPAFNLSFISLGYLARIVRASMLEVLRQDYIIMARSKGLPERVVIYRHALRNALIPALTLTGLFFAGLLGGAIITETVFSWPGVGRVSLLAVFQGDSNFLLLYSLVTALIIVVSNLVVDVMYVFLDPRIKY
jgi:ABC-type dipeptide/oligopeptide/nickel transport system permease component